jgi:hypothetical protein
VPQPTVPPCAPLNCEASINYCRGCCMGDIIECTYSLLHKVQHTCSDVAKPVFGHNH